MSNNTEKGKTILFIDDEEDFVHVAAITLEMEGYAVLRAYDGRQGVALYEKLHQSIDLVLCDLHMPNISGTAVIQIILQINPAVPLIIMSGSVDEQDLPPLINHPSCSYLQKPFSMQKLAETVRENVV